ncbi:hypothetical protein pb186bvf_006460 [Paramecium bursaria]
MKQSDIFAQKKNLLKNLLQEDITMMHCQKCIKFQVTENTKFKGFYDNDQIIILQDGKVILGQKYYENILRIFQAPQQEIKQNVDVNDDQKQNRISQTDSLSFLEDLQENFNIFDSDNLNKLLKEKGNVFTQIQSIDFIITSYKQQNQCIENFEVLISQGNYSGIFHGYCLKRQENIAIKIENYCQNQFFEKQFQYEIQYDIYSKYPQIFLKIDLPVFLTIYNNQQMQIFSKLELGQLNLFNYCLQNKIIESELVLIKNQILNQILLLHKHNIAHRDVKPQNVVFVKEKGWLLCDFEFSILYRDKICVTDIKGTKCFLPPGLRLNSCLAGVQLKQDLLYNDLYALGITMLIIKNQIQNSNQVDEFIKIEQDPEILNLLGQQYNINQQAKIENGIRFVNPILIQIEADQSEQLDEWQLFSMLQTLKAFGDTDIELRHQLIRIIDKNLKSDREDYLFYNFYIYQALELYIPDFKNLIPIQALKSIKFWKRILKICTPMEFIKQIQFMQTLGLSDIILQFGKKILNQNYSITTHVCIIQQLLVLRQFDQVIEEYKNMIKFKDFQFLSSEDQLLLVEVSSQLFDYDLIEQNDLNYFSEYYQDKQKTQQYANHFQFEQSSLLIKMRKCHNPEQKLAVLINSFESLQRDFGIDKINYKIKFALSLYNIAFDEIDFKSLIQFNKIMIEKLKHFCQMTLYQQLMKQQIYLQFLYDHSKQKQSYKKLNIVMIYYPESQQQQIVLDLIKQCSILIYQIKKQQKLKQIISKILKLCQYYEQLEYNFYKILFLDTITQIIGDQRYHNSLIFQQWFRVLLWFYKHFYQFNTQLGLKKLGIQYKNLIFDWMKLRGRKRHDNLVNDMKMRNKKTRQLYEINYVDKKSIEFLHQTRQFNLITLIFVREQYFSK